MMLLFADFMGLCGRAVCVVLVALALAVVLLRCSEVSYDECAPFCGAVPGFEVDNSLPPTFGDEQEEAE